MGNVAVEHEETIKKTGFSSFAFGKSKSRKGDVNSYIKNESI